MIQREKEGRGFNFFHFMIDLTGDHVWQRDFPVVEVEQSI